MLFDRASVHGVEWDEGNRSKCQKHGMTIADVEHVLMEGRAIFVPARSGSDDERLVAIGVTAAGRYAFVVVTPRPHEGRLMLRPVSARFMHGREIRKYEQAIAGPRQR